MFSPLLKYFEPSVNVLINGIPMRVPEGCSAAAAILLQKNVITRTSTVSDSPRAPYCMMGVCFECFLQIDGKDNQQGCLVIVTEGMSINVQLS